MLSKNFQDVPQLLHNIDAYRVSRYLSDLVDISSQHEVEKCLHVKPTIKSINMGDQLELNIDHSEFPNSKVVCEETD